MSVHIALLMMLKNEEKRILVSLESVKDYVNSIIIYDTGSTDNTIQIVKDFCEKHNLPLRLKEGEFVNFGVSRSVSLEFADTFTEVDFLLLLDCNDTLKGGDILKQFAIDNKDTENSGFLVCQEWWSGNLHRYYNTRFIKARNGWRYRGSVHEYMENIHNAKTVVKRVPDTVVLYQDRTQDDNKTSQRFTRDKILLLRDHKCNRTDSRTVFYLAQTLSCLNEVEEAFYYYKLRTIMEGFYEEKYHAFFRTGEISATLGHPWSDTMGWYMKAFEMLPRVEPMIKIAEYYKNIKNWRLAYTFIKLACGLDYPEELILFVDKLSYTYTRWHIMGIVAYYHGEYADGKKACLNALKENPESKTDTFNLKFYEGK